MTVTGITGRKEERAADTIGSGLAKSAVTGRIVPTALGNIRKTARIGTEGI